MQLFNKPLELVILDVDGVILDLRARFRKNLEMAARFLGLSIKSIEPYLASVELDKKRSGLNFREGLRLIWPEIPDTQLDRYIGQFREIERLNPYPPIPGSIQVILWLRDRNIPVALCTANDRETLRYRFNATKIDLDWFVHSSTEEHKYQKPDPRALDPIFTTIDAPREHAVYIGDWYPDLETARGAGVRFLGVTSGYISRHAFIREGVPHNHIIERLADLRKLIVP